MFPLFVSWSNTWTEPPIAVEEGIHSKPRKYRLMQFRRFFVFCIVLYCLVFVLIFPTVHLTVHYELVDVEPATHGEGVQAAKVQTWDDKVAMTLIGPFIPLRCYNLNTVVERK